MSDKFLTSEQTEAQTNQFLQSNGPPKDIYEVDRSIEDLLVGRTELEKQFYRSQNKLEKMMHWMVPQIVGLKGAHRVIKRRLEEGDERFKGIEDSAKSEIATHTKADAEQFKKINETLAPFVQLRERWIAKKGWIKHGILAIASVIFLSFLPALAIEWLKHYFNW